MARVVTRHGKAFAGPAGEVFREAKSLKSIRTSEIPKIPESPD